MRIVFLNSWFGKVKRPLFDFVRKESSRTDIFCFMEFTPELFAEVSKILPGYNGFIEKGMLLKSWGVIDCQVIFAKDNLEVLSSGELKIYRNTPQDTGFASYITFKKGGDSINILNAHGKARPGHKMDTPARIKQSRKIIEFMNGKYGLKIIGGDFNLMPNTKSVAMFEEAGYKNLIREFDIKETRSQLNHERYKEEEIQHFADYVFVSKDVKVNKFEVPYMEISDHLPLILDFEI